MPPRSTKCRCMAALEMQSLLRRGLRPTLSSLLCCEIGCSTARLRHRMQPRHDRPCSDYRAATLLPPLTRRTVQSMCPPPDPAPVLRSLAGGSRRSPSSRRRRAQPAVGSETTAHGEALAGMHVQTSQREAPVSGAVQLQTCSRSARRRQTHHLMCAVLHLTLPPHPYTLRPPRLDGRRREAKRRGVCQRKGVH